MLLERIELHEPQSTPLQILFGLPLTRRSGPGKVQGLMTSAQTRVPVELLTRLAGACALILFVVILILPH
jgi:hypothetical protein